MKRSLKMGAGITALSCAITVGVPSVANASYSVSGRQFCFIWEDEAVVVGRSTQYAVTLFMPAEIIRVTYYDTYLHSYGIGPRWESPTWAVASVFPLATAYAYCSPV